MITYKGRSIPQTFEEIVDLSINQTLSRTLWTSLTVLIVTLVLLFFGTDAVTGFAFIFTVGLLSGTYSTIFIAGPALIALHKRAMARREALRAEASAWSARIPRNGEGNRPPPPPPGPGAPRSR